MSNLKKELLPRIQERRLKTQEKNASQQSRNIKFRKFTYNLKNSISNSEYLKNWLQKDEENKKMNQIFRDAHKPQQNNRFSTLPSSKQTSSLQKDTIEAHQHELADHQSSPAITESQAAKKGTIKLNEPAPDEVQIFYHLEIKRGNATKEKIRNFRIILEEHNLFFQKMSSVINETLLNIGIVNTYKANDYIYKESFPIKSIGIILWGSVNLKYKKCKVKFNCTPGNTIGQQVIFQKLDYNSKKYSSVQNGRLCTNQRCKAGQDCGILFIGEKQYGYMHEDLIKWGFKQEMMRFQNILHRNYFKKREFRSLMN